MDPLVAKNLEDEGLTYDSSFRSIRNSLIVLSVLISLGFFFKYSWRRRNYMKNLPSRKVGFFDVWGNFNDVRRNEIVKEANSNVYFLQTLMGYKELFKNENFFHLSFGHLPFIIVAKAQAVEETISGSKNLQKNWNYNWFHPWLATGLLTSHGSKWKARRKLLTNAFHADVLKNFLPVFNEQGMMLVKQMRSETKKPWTDIVKPVTLCSLDIVCETILGVSIGAQEKKDSEYIEAVERASRALVKRAFWPPYLLDWYYYNFTGEGIQYKKDVDILRDFTYEVIREKKTRLLKQREEMKDTKVVEVTDEETKKRKALMDLLLEEHVENKALNEEDIREEVDTFTFEGHHTTSMGMSWTLYLLGLYPEIQERVAEEIDRVYGDDQKRPVSLDDFKDFEFLDRVIKESMRLYPPVPLIARITAEDTVVCGSAIPKGVSVFILPYLVHRDESVYPDPEKFDPDRFLPENTAKRSPYAYIPFSTGARNCIGRKFAMMKEKVVLVHFLRNYTVESLDARDKVLPSPELILKTTQPIRIKITPRKPL